MQNLNFQYDIKLVNGSELLKDRLFGACFPGIGEMIVASKTFNDYTECEKAFTGLLAVLASLSTQLTEKNYVIVTKANPDYSAKPEDAGTINGEAPWDKSTLMRAYVADADALKQKQLVFGVMGHIKIDPLQLESFSKSLEESIPQ